MQTNDQTTTDPDVIATEIETTRAKLAQDVEAIAFHKTHLKEEVKEAVHDKVTGKKQEVKDQVVETAENVKENVSDKAGHLKETLAEKKDELVEVLQKAKEKVTEAVHRDGS